MKEIEVTEEKIIHGSHVYAKGKQTVEDNLAAYFCSNGWAKSEEIKTGERSLMPRVVSPEFLNNAEG